MTFEQMQAQIEANFLAMYQMDYEFGIYDKNGMKNLVKQGFLSAENYKKIVGDDYVAEPAQTTPSAQV